MQYSPHDQVLKTLFFFQNSRWNCGEVGRCDQESITWYLRCRRSFFVHEESMVADFSWLFKRFNLTHRLIGGCGDMLEMVCSLLRLLIKSKLVVALALMTLLGTCSQLFMRFRRVGLPLRQWIFFLATSTRGHPILFVRIMQSQPPIYS